VPGENRFPTYQIHFAISKALSGVDVGATGFDVVAVDLLREGTNCEEENDCRENSWKAKTHWIPHPKTITSIFLQDQPGSKGGSLPIRGPILSCYIFSMR
jgi:hypothetical protein